MEKKSQCKNKEKAGKFREVNLQTSNDGLSSSKPLNQKKMLFTLLVNEWAKGDHIGQVY